MPAGESDMSESENGKRTFIGDSGESSVDERRFPSDSDCPLCHGSGDFMCPWCSGKRIDQGETDVRNQSERNDSDAD